MGSDSCCGFQVTKARKHRNLSIEPLETRQMLAAITEWSVRGVGGGGALFGPSISPHDSDHLYVSSDMSQMFRSDDGGDSWSTEDFRQLQGGSKAQVQFTSDPNILYTIDGSGGGAVDIVRPAKSTDGGTTWNQLTADPTSGEVFSLRADYSNPNRLVVGGWNTLYLSSDGGASFQQKFATNDGAGLHLAGAFFDGPNIFIGTNVGLLVSSNNGQSFAVANSSGIPADERVVSMTAASEGGTTRAFAVTMHENDVWNGVPGSDRYGFRSVYRADLTPTGSAQWTSISSGLPTDAYGFYVASGMDDIDTVYVAGSEGVFPAVYKSTNGGNSWTSVFETANNGNIQTSWSGSGGDQEWWYGETAMGFSIDPTNPDNAVITDFGFAHRTTDGGASWTNLNVHPDDRNPAGQNTPQDQAYRSSGLDNSVTWDLSWANSSRLIAAQTDIQGTVSNDGGESWSFDYSGHDQNTMYRVIKHSQSGTTYAATSTVHDLYQSTRVGDGLLDPGEGKVLFSNDDGTSWQTMHDFGHIVSWVAEDPTNPNRLYASVVHSTEGGIYASNDIQNGSSSSWTRLTSPPRTEGHPFNIRVLNDGTLVTSYSARMTSSAVFSASSGVFASTDGGQTWSDRSHPDMQYWTKDIVIDPHDATQNTWYAGVWSGWGGPANDRGGLFKSTNRGQSWQKLFDQHRVSSATISPTDPSEMYVTTETAGLWYTDTLTDAAPDFEQVDSFNFRQPDRVFYNPYDNNEVWVSSFGDSLAVGRNDMNAIDGDFNDDGIYDTLDVDALTDVIANQTNTLAFDLTGDGVVDINDLNAWRVEAGIALGFSSPVAVGDANVDGVVDVSDFNLWNAHKFAADTAWSHGNFNADLAVDVSDFNLWNTNKFTSSFDLTRNTPALHATPEMNEHEERNDSLETDWSIRDQVFGTLDRE